MVENDTLQPWSLGKRRRGSNYSKAQGMGQLLILEPRVFHQFLGSISVFRPPSQHVPDECEECYLLGSFQENLLIFQRGVELLFSLQISWEESESGYFIWYMFVLQTHRPDQRTCRKLNLCRANPLAEAREERPSLRGGPPWILVDSAAVR